MWSQYLRLWRDWWSGLAREVGDLVGGPARVREKAVREVEELGLVVGRGARRARPGRRAPRTRVRGWIGELVAREVPRRQRHGRLQIAPPGLRGLAGQAEDEVDRDGVEAGRVGGLDGGPRLAARCGGGRGSAGRRRENDCTPRERVRTPRRRQAAQASGVTSSGLASRKTQGAGTASARCARQASSTRARSSGGSSDGVPPPKYTVSKGLRSGHARGREGHLGDQAVDEARPDGRGGAHHREVAVRADGRAEGDVEVEPGRARRHGS